MRSVLGRAALLLVLVASPCAFAADLEPIELPLSFRPILTLQPRLLLRAEDRAGSKEIAFLPTLLRAEVGFAVSGRFLAVTVAADGSRGVPELRDAYVDADLLDGSVALRAGYLRPPLGREYLAASDRHALPADPLSLVVVVPQRELGAMLHGRIAGFLAYAVGAWSGFAEGLDGTRQVGDLIVLSGGRVAVEPLGPLPAEAGASDLDRGGPRLALGAAALYGRRRRVPFPGRAEAGTEYGEDRLRVGGEAAFQWAGVSATAEMYWSRAWPVPGTSAVIEPQLPRVDGLGGYLQLAAFVVRRRLELAARCDAWDEDVDVGGALLAPMAGVSFYAQGTHVVFRLGYRVRFAVMDPFPAQSPYNEPVTHDVMAMAQLAL